MAFSSWGMSGGTPPSPKVHWKRKRVRGRADGEKKPKSKSRKRRGGNKRINRLRRQHRRRR